MYRWTTFLVLVVCSVVSIVLVQAADVQAQKVRQPYDLDRLQIGNSVNHMPLAFTKNMGQWPDSILFRASSGGTTMWFTKDGIYYQFTQRIPQPHARSAAGGGHPGGLEQFGRERDSIATTMIKAQFVGANPSVEVLGLEEQVYKCNYFLGDDPGRWHTDIPNYSIVTFKNLYPGVDMSFRGQRERLEYEQKATSQTAFDQVQVEYQGADTAVRQPDGTVLVQTRLGDQAFAGPVPAAQVSTTLTETAAVAASPGAIWLIYSTYLGGSTPDAAYGIAVDISGNAFVTGQTYSANFPKLNPLDNALGGNDDAFVTKLTAAGTGLVYATYLGGSGEDAASGIAVSATGNAYLTGQTSSADFPRLNAVDNALGGTWDGFVTKLSPTGSALVYSTYLGGSGIDLANDIAVDTTGKACVTGTTRSTDFPRLNAFDNTLGGEIDGFVTKLGAAGSSLVFSTFLGGDGSDCSYAIAVNELGDAYVTGSTSSGNFPVQAALQTNLAGDSDVFVTKLSSGGNTLDYSTYLGGSGDDIGSAIVYGGPDYVYVTGHTVSTNFPTYASVGRPYQSSLQGATDAFVVELSHTSSQPLHHTALVYSTYLGGRFVDKGRGIARKGGEVFVTGYTYSDNFPVLNAYQSTFAGGSYDAFVTRLSAGGGSLTYSTYLGGGGYDEGRDIAVDTAICAYVTGYTASTNFPTQTPYQRVSQSYDAFVTKLSASAVCCSGTTGNVNMLGIVDVSDLSLLVAYLTMNPGPTLQCPTEANVNTTGIIDVSDLSLLVAYLTMNPPPSLPNCP